MQYNILTKDFYNHLTTVIYNGPPETIYGKFDSFFLHSGNEKEIIKALHKCQSKHELYENIINPSDDVTIAYLKEEYFAFEKIKNPSKNVIKFAITKHNEIFKNHKHLFNDQEILELIKKSPWIIKYIDSPTYEQYEIAVKNDGFTICCVENQTLELCKTALNNIINNKYLYITSTILKNMKFIDEEMINSIVDSKFILYEFKNIPEHFLNPTLIKRAIESCPLCLKYLDDKYLTQELCELAFNDNINCFPYIPHHFQKKYMIDKIKLEKKYDFAPFMGSLDQEYCDQMFSDAVYNIKYIPSQYQTKEMCMKVVERSHHNLKYCSYIDNDILEIIFKSKYMTNVPRKDRFKFILDFDENVIAKIIHIKPYLLSIIPADKQTDKIIKTALHTDGYSLQYVVNKKDEYINIALENQPKAIKYTDNYLME
ncbi:hypothetical protein QLL95_gp0473 [Cotonvirus japonicus]|uniref:DUF4116 domain-containing protein n=1 Tax=Cotonvirus japonicus TaxID=2811091 RepID=A0ABM7NTZ2_9VIRU|nr:hypothetical protein QLL95_gp0473 [Cotonvirus japonicus]BCS83650.1 hypothetical protein [Cotonvirus japonicus]